MSGSNINDEAFDELKGLEYQKGYNQAVLDTENSLKRHILKYSINLLKEMLAEPNPIKPIDVYKKVCELEQELCRVTPPIGLPPPNFVDDLF